jgi:hypothetical protein
LEVDVLDHRHRRRGRAGRVRRGRARPAGPHPVQVRVGPVHDPVRRRRPAAAVRQAPSGAGPAGARPLRARPGRGDDQP